ncbi:MAG TPA: hypothetical protein G4N96_01100 [Chloroflexi bacterium]|nr:hypothetical protein [Chloroflexota bacterium]
MNKYSFTLIVIFGLLTAVLLLAWDQAVEVADTLLTVTMWSLVALLVLLPLGMLTLGLWFLSNRFIDNRQKWAEASLLTAQARQADKQADNLIITANPGEQVYIASDQDINRRSITALHLQRSYRSNGNGDSPLLHESTAWALMQHLHSTVNAPRNITHNAPQLPAGNPPETAAVLPQHLDLLPLIDGQSPSLNRVIIGQTVDEAGQLETLTMPLTEMVHVGMVGSSGWGKSVGVQSLALQLALASETLEMVFIDLEGVTSAPFQRLNRLRYPIAETEKDAVAILNDLKGEMDRRMSLFSPHRVQKVSDYNALTDVTPLPFIAVFIDEATSILENNAAIHDLLAQSVIQLRKTGVFLFLAGQEMSSKSMRPMIRRQLSSRIAYHVGDHWQAQGLGIGKEAVYLNTKGRAWTIFPGRQKALVQTPFVDAAAIEGLLERAGRAGKTPSTAMPTRAEPEPTPREQTILQMWDDNASLNQISKEINGQRGGTYNNEIKEVLKKHGVSV